MKNSDLTEGQYYKVLRPSALEGMKSIGNSAWQGTTHRLKVGTVIKYLGHKRTIGTGSVRVPIFVDEEANVRGEFSPAGMWGKILPEYLEDFNPE